MAESTPRAQLAAGPDWVAAAACLALLLLMIFPAVSGAIAGLLALAGLVAALRGARPGPSERQFATLCLLLPAAYVFNMVLKGWQSNLLDRPMHLAYAVLLAMLISRRGLEMRTVFFATVAAALVAGAVALFETSLAGQERVFGLGGRWNAVPFGNFSLLIGFCALAGGVSAQGRDGARLALLLGGLGCAAGLYASMMSGSRGGWLALPVLAVIAAHAGAAVAPRQRAAIAAALMVGALASFTLSERVRERAISAVEDVSAFISAPGAAGAMDNSSGIRLAMWRWGVDRFHEEPLTGIGYAQFSEYRARAVANGELPAHFDSLANLHNELVSQLACGGLPSAIALISFWVLGWRFFAARLRGSREPASRYFATIGLMTLVGTAIFAMTEGLFGTRPGTYALMLLLALPAGALFHLERSRVDGASA